MAVNNEVVLDYLSTCLLLYKPSFVNILSFYCGEQDINTSLTSETCSWWLEGLAMVKYFSIHSPGDLLRNCIEGFNRMPWQYWQLHLNLDSLHYRNEKFFQLLVNLSCCQEQHWISGFLKLDGFIGI